MVASVSAIVVGYRRLDALLETLSRVYSCLPVPAQVLVHLDGGSTISKGQISGKFPAVEILVSSKSIGPGGGRNRLIGAAKYEYVASFDDDSYPIDRDYFQRIECLFKDYPEAVVLAASVFHRSESPPLSSRNEQWVATFIGCGCAYRRSGFLQTAGYVPLTTAYGMEELDLSLRLHAASLRILSSNWLRVYHDTDLRHRGTLEIVAANMRNLALLPWLRYPPCLWPLGCWHVLSGAIWALRHGQFRGTVRGLLGVGACLRTYSACRKPLGAGSVLRFRQLLRHPIGAKPPFANSGTRHALELAWRKLD